MILFVGIFKGWLLNKLLTRKWIIIIGGMCYSIYLVHYAVIYFLTQTFTRSFFTYNYSTDIVLQSAILIPCVLLVSAIFFVLFERPFMDIRWPQQLKTFLRKSYSHIFFSKNAWASKMLDLFQLFFQMPGRPGEFYPPAGLFRFMVSKVDTLQCLRVFMFVQREYSISIELHFLMRLLHRLMRFPLP